MYTVRKKYRRFEITSCIRSQASHSESLKSTSTLYSEHPVGADETLQECETEITILTFIVGSGWSGLSGWSLTHPNGRCRAAKNQSYPLVPLESVVRLRDITREFFALSGGLCHGLALHRKSRQRSSITWKTSHQYCSSKAKWGETQPIFSLQISQDDLHFKSQFRICLNILMRISSFFHWGSLRQVKTFEHL